MESLPDELHCKIIEYLDVEDIPACSRVNRGFYKRTHEVYGSLIELFQYVEQLKPTIRQSIRQSMNRMLVRFLMLFI